MQDDRDAAYLFPGDGTTRLLRQDWTSGMVFGGRRGGSISTFLRQTGESDMRGKGYRWAPIPQMVEVVESVDFEESAEGEADDKDVDEEADDNEPKDKSAEDEDASAEPVDVMAQTLQSLAIAACEEVDAAKREPGMLLRPVED